MAHLGISDLTVRFGDFCAVDKVSLDVADGEIVIFLGPSGCGKTTTLRCIAGLEQPTAGDILFDGQRVNALHPAERNIAMVFQFVSLYPHLRVRDNIAFPLRARGVASREIRRKLDWIAATFKLDDIMHSFPAGLPPGAKQKVALARAVVREPNVLLLDEPLSAIDEQFREEMRWELGHLQKQLGFTTIYVTHDQREAMSLADRIVLMRDGRIVQVGAPRAMYAEPVNEFAGFFIGSPGMSFIDVTLADGALLLGRERVALVLTDAVAAGLARHAQGALKLGVRPQHVFLEKGATTAGAFKAEVVDRYRVGRERFFDFRIDDALYQGIDRLDDGGVEEARIRVATDNIYFFDGATGERLQLPPVAG